MLKIHVTPDIQLREQVKAALKECDGYCPCKILQVPENKCMCKEFIEQDYPGCCECGLYYKEEV